MRQTRVLMGYKDGCPNGVYLLSIFFSVVIVCKHSDQYLFDTILYKEQL